MTFIYRRVATWARLPTMEPDAGGRCCAATAALSGWWPPCSRWPASVGCVVALGSGLLPQDWTQGFWWGAVVMLSVPAHVFNVVGTRLLVVARKQHFMVGIAVTTAVLNAALDTPLYLWLGPIGIVVATVVLRWVMAGVYVVLLRRSSRRRSARSWLTSALPGGKSARRPDITPPLPTSHRKSESGVRKVRLANAAFARTDWCRRPL